MPVMMLLSMAMLIISIICSSLAAVTPLDDSAAVCGC